MTQEEVKMRAELYSALAEGKTIQVKNPNGTWEDVKIEGLNRIYDYNNYRIKPESKYRPFKTQEECWNEMLKHQPFGWLKPVNKYTNKAKAINISSIGCDDEYPIQFTNDYGDYSFEYLYKEFNFIDGTPFGILEEE